MASSSRHTPAPAYHPDPDNICIQFNIDAVEAHYNRFFKNQRIWEEQGFETTEVEDQTSYEISIFAHLNY